MDFDKLNVVCAA